MTKITFSSDEGGFSLKDVEASGKQVKEYFSTFKQEEQAMPSKELNEWIFSNCQDYLNIIKDEGRFIGHCFMVPTSEEIMNQFLNKRINEKELFDLVMKEEVRDYPKAIYLCDSIIDKDYRRKGLALQGYLKMLRKFSKYGTKLYACAYSKEGEFLAKKLAEQIKLNLRLIKE